MKNLLSLLLLTTILITSCGEDDGTNGTSEDFTAEQAKAKMDNITSQAGDDVVAMVQSEGVDALAAFAELFQDFDQFSGRTEQKSWVKTKLDIITHRFVSGPAGRVNEDEFLFDDIKGVYDWNPELGDFEKSAASEMFIVNFPTEGSTSNNAQLKINDLQFITFTESDEFGEYTTELPTVIDASLSVDSEVFISVDATATWSSDGFPDEVDLTLILSEFEFNVTLNDLEALKTSVASSILKNGETLIAIDVDIEFETTDKEEPVVLGGFVQYSDLKVSGDIDARNLEDDADPNDYIDLEIFSGTQKLGDVVFVLEEVIEDGETYEEYIPYVEYSDGTKENLEDLLEPILEDIEEALEDFEGED